MTFWDHPVHFIQNILGAEPEPYQADVLDALAESPRVAVRSGHGVGKTAVAAWAVTWFLVTRPLSKVPTTAPTFEKQVRDILWAEIHRWVRESVLARELSLSQTRMAVKGFEEEWFAVGMSAERPENLEGFHAPHLLYVVDEAKGVSDSIFDGIQGALHHGREDFPDQHAGRPAGILPSGLHQAAGDLEDVSYPLPRPVGEGKLRPIAIFDHPPGFSGLDCGPQSGMGGVLARLSGQGPRGISG